MDSRTVDVRLASPSFHILAEVKRLHDAIARCSTQKRGLLPHSPRPIEDRLRLKRHREQLERPVPHEQLDRFHS